MAVMYGLKGLRENQEKTADPFGAVSDVLPYVLKTYLSG
jgi:hypothetical protein